MINVGENNISVYAGDSEVSVYIGSELIYPLNFGELTGITMTDLTWVTDIPYSGGTGTSANCSYVITGYYDSGKTRKLNSRTTVEGSITADSTTSETRDLVGTLVLTATCSGFSVTGSVDAYQAKYAPWVDLGTIDNTVPFDAIGWVTGYTIGSDRWTAEKSGITSDNMSWTNGFNETNGWFSQHRWGPASYGNKYTCDFLHESLAPDIGPRADLPTETINVNGNSYTINVLEYKNFQNWKPCYGAYSNPSNKYGSGQVFVRMC